MYGICVYIYICLLYFIFLCDMIYVYRLYSYDLGTICIYFFERERFQSILIWFVSWCNGYVATKYGNGLV